MSQNSPLISVVIPVFNGAPYVARAVESIRLQTVKPVEIIIVDDGSTDGTQQELRKLEGIANIRWYQRDHGGPARSRNFGIQEAKGEFLALLDCDDIWLPDKLALQLAVFDANPQVGLVHTDFEVVYPDGTIEERVSARKSREPLVQAFAGGHTALPSTLMVRKCLLDRVGGLNPELYGSEDSDLTIRLYDITAFECVDCVLVRKLQKGHGYRDMAFAEQAHNEKVLSSRKQFLQSLEARPNLRPDQRAALDREWANYFLRCGKIAQQEGRVSEARRFYGLAIRKAPFRFRGYTRWMKTVVGWR